VAGFQQCFHIGNNSEKVRDRLVLLSPAVPVLAQPMKPSLGQTITLFAAPRFIVDSHFDPTLVYGRPQISNTKILSINNSNTFLQHISFKLTLARLG